MKHANKFSAGVHTVNLLYKVPGIRQGKAAWSRWLKKKETMG